MKPKQSITKLTLKYFWKKTSKYKKMLFFYLLSVFFAVLGGAFVNTLLFREIFDLMIQNPEAPKNIYNEIIILFLWLSLSFWVLQFFGWRIAEFINSVFQAKIMRDIEKDCFDNLQNHSFTFFADNFSGSIVSRVNRLSKSYERIADIIQWNLWPISLRAITAIIIIFYFHLKLGLIFLIWVVVYIIASFYGANWTGKFWRYNAKEDSKVTGELADNISNIFNVKIFSAQNSEKKRFWNTILFRQKIRTKAWISSAWLNTWQAVYMISFEILIVYLMIQSWENNILSIGTMFAIQAFVWMLFDNLWNLGRLFRDYAGALADAEEMTEILNKIPEIQDPKNPEKCKIAKGKIEFKNVNFQYEKDKKSPQIFKKFNLNIKAGERVGLVGESGSGKSTFVNLLLRFYDLTNGIIEIDGQNITKITQNDLRSAISYVPQESVLFHRSLAENIAYGKQDASFDEIVLASKKAHAHEFILETTDKYKTLVGERGIKLSGGQKQRIAIARAMLKDAPILILDEATSALDSRSEREIQKAFEEIFQSENRTTIVVAHRLSTLRKMDKIIVMDMGKIVEEGSHEELLKKKGKYAELWNHQIGGFVG